MAVMYRSSKRESGFTLIEMMIVIAVFAIMAMIAIPTFMSLRPGMRLNKSTRDIFVAMNRARMGAAGKNSIGNIQFTTTTYTAWVDNPAVGCTPYALDGIDYQQTVGTTETGVTISQNIPNDTFAYNSRGLPSGTSVASTITLTNSEGDTQQIQINALGSIKIL